MKKRPLGEASAGTRLLKDLDLYLMLLAGLALLIVFKYVPMAGILIAFKDFDIFEGFSQSPWVGFANFRELFNTGEFLQVMENTLLISLYKIIFFFPMPIILALCLNEITALKYKRTLQTIVYLPHFISWVVVSGIVFDLLSSSGMINNLIYLLGGERVRFLMDPSLFRSLVVASATWKEVGYSAIVYLAGIASIDPSLYEAAVMDGAGKAKQIRYITLPGLTPIIVIMLLLRVGTIMDAGSEQIMALYNPTVYETGDVINTFTYRLGLTSMRYSFASAAGLFNSVISFLLVAASNAFCRRVFKRSLW